MYHKLSMKQVGDRTEVSGPCVFTNKVYTVSVLTAELEKYISGAALIQDAMPSVSREEREFIISGISPEGWSMI